MYLKLSKSVNMFTKNIILNKYFNVKDLHLQINFFNFKLLIFLFTTRGARK